MSLINKDLALTYCGGMEELFAEILSDFRNSGIIDELKKCFDAKDWDNYRIQAHSMKSSSLTVGAESVSETFKKLEFACKDSDYAYVEANHAAACALFDELAKEMDTLL